MQLLVKNTISLTTHDRECSCFTLFGGFDWSMVAEELNVFSITADSDKSLSKMISLLIQCRQIHLNILPKLSTALILMTFVRVYAVLCAHLAGVCWASIIVH